MAKRTSEERAALAVKARELREKGFSYQKIADQLGAKSPNTVRCWLDPDIRDKANAGMRRYYQEHRQEIREKQKIYREADKDGWNVRAKEYYQNHKAEHYAQGKKWREEHPQRAREIETKYREKHRKELSEKSRQWQKDNKERSEETRRRYVSAHKDEYLAHARLRRARIKKYDKISQEEYDTVFKQQKGLCIYCGRKMRTTRDPHHPLYKTQEHIYPVSKGGSHSLDNFAYACRKCNSSKNSKTVAEWRPELLVKVGNGVAP